MFKIDANHRNANIFKKKKHYFHRISNDIKWPQDTSISSCYFDFVHLYSGLISFRFLHFIFRLFFFLFYRVRNIVRNGTMNERLAVGQQIIYAAVNAIYRPVVICPVVR